MGIKIFNLILSIILSVSILLAMLPTEINPFGFNPPKDAGGIVMIYGLSIIFLLASFIPWLSALLKGRIEESSLRVLNIGWLSIVGLFVFLIIFMFVMVIMGQGPLGELIGKAGASIIVLVLVILSIIFYVKYYLNKSMGGKLRGFGLFNGILGIFIGLFLLWIFILVLVIGKEPFGSPIKILALILFFMFGMGVLLSGVMNILMSFGKWPKPSRFR